MNSGLPEWTFDWYGPYTAGAQTDPVGVAAGLAKVIRGGSLDTTKLGSAKAPEKPVFAAYFYRSANRAGLPPSFGPPPPDYVDRQLSQPWTGKGNPRPMPGTNTKSPPTGRL